MAYYGSNYPPNQGYGYPPNSGPPPPPGGGYGGGYGYGQRMSAYNVNYGSGYQQGQYGQQAYGQGYGGYSAHYQTGSAAPPGGQHGYSGGYGGAVQGFTAPQAPPMQQPQSMMCNNAQNQMMMYMMKMQKEALMQIADVQREARKRPGEEGFDPEEDRKAEMEEVRRLQEKAASDESFMEKAKQTFKTEWLRRLAISGTLDMTEGTIKPLLTYPEGDPVNLWHQENRSEELTSKKWDAEFDCEYLYAAMEGLGTNEDAIIDVITTRCNDQRQEMKKMFKTLYGKDLIKELESELSGDFRETVMAMFVPPATYDAWAIKNSIYGLGTDEAALIEILMTRTNPQIEEMRKAYPDVINKKQKIPDSQIEKDIEDDTSGDFKRLLISASQGNRKEIDEECLDGAIVSVKVDDRDTGLFEVDISKLSDADNVKRDADALNKAGEDRWGTDEKTFIRIFARKDYYYLRAVYEEYVKITQRDIINSIDRETSGDFKSGLRAIAMNIKCRPMFFADRLVRAMKGAGTDDHTLIRIVVSRSEIDMVQIKECFRQLTGQTLWNYIKDDTSGDYKKLLLKIVGKN